MWISESVPSSGAGRAHFDTRHLWSRNESEDQRCPSRTEGRTRKEDGTPVVGSDPVPEGILEVERRRDDGVVSELLRRVGGFPRPGKSERRGESTLRPIIPQSIAYFC